MEANNDTPLINHLIEESNKRAFYLQKHVKPDDIYLFSVDFWMMCEFLTGYILSEVDESDLEQELGINISLKTAFVNLIYLSEGYKKNSDIDIRLNYYPFHGQE